MISGNERWQFWIDRGGTFTDIVARRPDGALIVRKLLSDNPERYADAAVAGIREILQLAPAAALPDEAVEAIKMGTTVATNALLERRGQPTALVITQGLGDALRIGYQNRPDIFALQIDLPAPLYDRVIEVEERVRADGAIDTRLNESRLRADLRSAPTARGCARLRRGLHARLSLSRARAARRSHRARNRFQPGHGEPRGQSAGEVRGAWRHHRDRRVRHNATARQYVDKLRQEPSARSGCC